MIHLDFRDSRPIYEQVKDGLRRLMVQGILAKDEKLPSVRELATTLAINPNTIQRAYRDLEQEGFLYTIAGKGSFAAGIPKQDTVRKGALFSELDSILEELYYLQVEKEEIEEHVTTCYSKKKEGRRKHD